MKEKPSQSCKKKLKKRSEKKNKKLSRLAKILRRRKKQQKAALVAAESSTLLDLRPPPLEINIIELERSNYSDLSWERLPPVQMQMRPAIALPPMQTEPSSAEPIRVSVRYLSSWLPHSAPLPVVVLLVTDHPPGLRPLPPPLLNLVIPALVAQTAPAPNAPTPNFSPPQQSFQSWPELLPRRHRPAEPVCRWPAVPLVRLIAESAAVPSTPPVPAEHPTAEQPASSNENSDGNRKSKKSVVRRLRLYMHLKKLIKLRRFQSPTGSVAMRHRQPGLAKKVWCFGKRTNKTFGKRQRWLISDRTVSVRHLPWECCIGPIQVRPGATTLPSFYRPAGPVRHWPAAPLARPTLVHRTAPAPDDEGSGAKQSASSSKNSSSRRKNFVVEGCGSWARARKFINPECFNHLHMVFVRLIGKKAGKGFEKNRRLERSLGLQGPRWSVNDEACPLTTERPPVVHQSPLPLPSLEMPPRPDEKPTAAQSESSNANSDGNCKSKKLIGRRARPYVYLKKLIELPRFQSPTDSVAMRRRRQRGLAKKVWCFGERTDKNSGKPVHHRRLAALPVQPDMMGPAAVTPSTPPVPDGRQNAKQSAPRNKKGLGLRGHATERSAKLRCSACTSQITELVRKRALSDLTANPSDAINDHDRGYDEALINAIIQAMAAASTDSESVGSVAAGWQRAAEEVLQFSQQHCKY